MKIMRNKMKLRKNETQTKEASEDKGPEVRLQ